MTRSRPRLTVQEVQTWFPERWRPALQHCETLTRILNEELVGQAWLLPKPHPEAMEHLHQASAALTRGRDHLVALRRIAPRPSSEPDLIADLIDVVDRYLRVFPAPERHRPVSPTDWRFRTRGWPPTIRQAIWDDAAVRGRARPTVSLDAKGGPVVTVMQQALSRVLGVNLSQARISNSLQEWPNADQMQATREVGGHIG
jgi:hypothetical protein